MKASATTLRALEILRDNPEVWPGEFGKLLWPQWSGERRNKVGGLTRSWSAAGYLGRLRAAGLVTGGGGNIELVALKSAAGKKTFSKVFEREPWRLTAAGKKMLADGLKALDEGQEK